MTNHIFLSDTYLYKSQAKITITDTDDKGYYIVLDQTIFYPQGGGQPSYIGMININNIDHEVTFVKQFGNEIRYYINNNANSLKISNNVFCYIDVERRNLNARYHTAAHLISNVVESIYPSLKAVKGHSFSGEAHVEFIGEGELDSNQIYNALVNTIEDGLEVTTFEISPSNFEQKFYKLPYSIPDNKVFRVMQIGEFAPIPCEGTYLKNIDEITGIKIRKISIKNSTTKISYELI